MQLIYTPSKKAARFLHFQQRSKLLASEVLKEAEEDDDLSDPNSMKGKDVLSVLGAHPQLWIRTALRL